MGTALDASPSRAHEVLRLRTEILRMQRRRADTALLPLDDALMALLPDGGLRVGSAYALSGSPSLIAALLAGPSRRGSWTAAVGMPTLGVEAASGFGIDLSRFVLVPDPGGRWLSVVSTLSEVFPLIAVRTPARLSPADSARLDARLRDRGCTLLVVGPWQQAEATITLEEESWEGLGAGWGLLNGREVTLSATTRQGERRGLRVRLPGAHGTAEALPQRTLRAIEDLPLAVAG